MNANLPYWFPRSSQFTDAVEEARRKHAEESDARILKRARIQNGKHPAYRKGHAKDAEKRGS